ncbi:hypothetical protein TEA_022227 [Camellia sinensis var. sinensis]|uniref:Proteasome alpha-type subunits domain-containing protein n=1 Tax=Camellia sinensis var. sinensis TaxID=542762 RepID=A0A4S4D8Z8_CAMSN|nr:hypothetical protein TEA_022227 [Camellia sinensis var. sinensis]
MWMVGDEVAGVEPYGKMVGTEQPCDHRMWGRLAFDSDISQVLKLRGLIWFSSNTVSADLRYCLLYRKSVCTQRSWKRPYGVGLLVAGLDESGAHLYYNCPSGNYFEYQAFAIGSRSQAAKTYLERRFESFISSTREDLLKDALFALRETLQGEKLKSSICTVSVVGVGEAFHILDNETVQALIDAFEIVGEEAPAAGEEAPAAEEAAAAEDQGDQSAPADATVAPMDI